MGGFFPRMLLFVVCWKRSRGGMNEDDREEEEENE